MNEKLANPDWEFKLSMSDGSSSLLVIEDPVQLRSTVVELTKQSNGESGGFILSDERRELDIHDRMVVITDPLNVDPSNKRVSNAITQQIKDLIISSDFFKEANDLVAHMERFADSVEDSCRLNVFHQDYEIANLYKILDIHLQVEFENELERVLEYMNVLHDVCGIDCFVFVSMFCYFNQEELSTLVREAIANKHNLLFIEGLEPSSVPEQTRKVIIDKDLCQIF